MTPSKILSLLPLVGDEAEFRKAISPYVRPKPWKHDFEFGSVCHVCRRCKKKVYYYEYIKNIQRDDCPAPSLFTGSLGDLAFELKDKANPLLFNYAMKELHEKAIMETRSWVDWFISEAKPEHWIIAALYALDLAKKEGK